jgi:hypothetical protein
MKKFLIVFVLSHNILGPSMGQSYKVLSVDKLYAIIKNDTVVEESQIAFNEAFLYKLSNDKFAIIPNVGAEGILFYDSSSLSKMISQRNFPVKNDGSIFEKHRDLMEKIEINYKVYLDQLRDSLNLEILLSDDPVYLKKLSRAINDFIKTRSQEDIFIPLGIFFNELLRNKVKGHWRLEKEYVLNPYFIPYVVDERNHVYSIWLSLDKNLKKNDFSCELFLECIMTE